MSASARLTGSGDQLEVALAFLGALDRNHADGLVPLVAPEATWWVDTGMDRAAGVFGHDPGADRPWPLHGTMPMDEKIELLRGLPTRFPGGCRQEVWHAFANETHAVVEVQGDGVTTSGRRYQNRYAFVLGLDGGRITEVREYLDTQHAADVMPGRHLDRRSEAPITPGTPAEPRTAAEETAVALVAAVQAADPERAMPLFAPGATWWADSGRKRSLARHDQPADAAPRNPMFGRVPVTIRVPLMRGLASMFTERWVLVPHRLLSGPSHVVMEVSSDGDSGGPKRYQNRYCFVLEMDGDRISAVREYCDTLHAFDVFRSG